MMAFMMGHMVQKPIEGVASAVDPDALLFNGDAVLFAGSFVIMR